MEDVHWTVTVFFYINGNVIIPACTRDRCVLKECCYHRCREVAALGAMLNGTISRCRLIESHTQIICRVDVMLDAYCIPLRIKMAQ